MAVPVEDKPIETLREEVVDQLIMNYAHGKISQAAFERRLNIASESKDHQQIMEQVADLELKVDNKFIQSKQTEMGVQYASEPVEEEESIFNLLSSNDRSGRWQVPKRIKLFSLLASSNLDFTDAEFYHPTVTIDVTSILGGEKIFIPENVNVVSKAFAVLGSIENTAPSVAGRNAPTIIIEGTVICGSIKIKVKRTVKERFLAFADRLKKVLQ